jgi:hypothetical protein
MSKSRDTIKYSPITLSCLLFLVGSVMAYLYFLNLSVVEVVMRTEYDVEVRDINTEIAALESRFITAQHEITQRIGDLEGFGDEVDKIFVSREQAALALSSRQ